MPIDADGRALNAGRDRMLMAAFSQFTSGNPAFPVYSSTIYIHTPPCKPVRQALRNCVYMTILRGGGCVCTANAGCSYHSSHSRSRFQTFPPQGGCVPLLLLRGGGVARATTTSPKTPKTRFTFAPFGRKTSYRLLGGFDGSHAGGLGHAAIPR